MSVLLTLLLPTVLAAPWKVLDDNFPDPSVIQTKDGFYAFGTTGNGVHAQIAHSKDFTSWEKLSHDALPGPFPSWVKSESPSIWAPDVIQRNDGTFVMYFSAIAKDERKHCIGAATSSSVRGPYKPAPNALACPIDQGGAIDAAGFKDSDGSFYVVYKIDGNSLNTHGGKKHPTPIMLQKLHSDALTPSGKPVQLLDRDDRDGPLVEAPSLVKHGDTYLLSFSSNMYNTKWYDVSYATAKKVTGPYTKSTAPLLESGHQSDVGKLVAPGGADFLPDGKRILFHAFNNGENMKKGRGVWAADISIDGGQIHI
ncbi:hypothetical protein EYZ11_000341 [Aspergillus tanneri]|nr:hypothetical protein EYZ11_000341 [Aspergillus tanneri]